MTLHGYLVDVDWDGRVLTAHGTNAISRAALGGEKGSVRVTDDQLREVELRRPKGTRNGCVRVYTRGGIRHDLHFRPAQITEFEALASQLSAATTTSPTAALDAQVLPAEAQPATEAPAPPHQVRLSSGLSPRAETWVIRSLRMETWVLGIQLALLLIPVLIIVAILLVLLL